jgi:hypothetical protein
MQDLGMLGWSKPKVRLGTNTTIARIRNSTFNAEKMVDLLIGVAPVYSLRNIAHKIYIEK